MMPILRKKNQTKSLLLGKKLPIDSPQLFHSLAIKQGIIKPRNLHPPSYEECEVDKKEEVVLETMTDPPSDKEPIFTTVSTGENIHYLDSQLLSTMPVTLPCESKQSRTHSEMTTPLKPCGEPIHDRLTRPKTSILSTADSP